MPYEPTSRVLMLCDALASAIEAAWAASSSPGPVAPDEVVRKYLSRVRLETFKGRRVAVFPTRYADEPADRGEVFATYPVTIWVAECCPDAMDMASDAAIEWTDERVDFVESVVYAAIDYGSQGLAPLVVGSRKGVVLQSADVAVYDPELLDSNKTFWSELECVFRELD